MSNFTTQQRLYMKPGIDEYGYYTRSFLGLSKSAVIQSDDGRYIGYAGTTLDQSIVDPATGQDGTGASITLPTDFRTVGIEIMNGMGIPEQTQVTMFNNFMSRYTKEQRDLFVAQYDAVDKNDPAQVQAFVDEMQTMLA